MYVVWTSYRVIFFPCFLYVATIGAPGPSSCLRPMSPAHTSSVTGLGIIELYASGKPNADFFVGTAQQLGVAYYTTTIALNIIATGVITARLAHLGRALEAARNTQDRGRSARRYTGTLPIVVESALPYSMAGFAFLVAYGLQSDISILFGAFYGMFTVRALDQCTLGAMADRSIVVHLAAADCVARRDRTGMDEGPDGAVRVRARVREPGHEPRGGHGHGRA